MEIGSGAGAGAGAGAEVIIFLLRQRVWKMDRDLFHCAGTVLMKIHLNSLRRFRACLFASYEFLSEQYSVRTKKNFAVHWSKNTWVL